MEKFNGFPPGEVRLTRIPDIFFARLLPQIDDLAELKVTLHLLWIRQRNNKEVVSLAELHTDETLIHGLAIINSAADPFELLADGLQKSVQRNTLLYARVANQDGEHHLYFLNSESGRLAFEETRAGNLGVVAVTGADIASPTYARRPNIFELYEANIGLLSPILADELKDAELAFPPTWIEEAFKIAVENNVRKWSYIRTILERMATEGKDYGTAKRKTESDTPKRWYTDDELEQLIQH